MIELGNDGLQSGVCGIFVFGSNLAGIHGAGAARFAIEKHQAIYGVGTGLQGSSYAIPTKDQYIETLPLHIVKVFIDGFKAYAASDHRYIFDVTRIGCGLAGFTDEQIAPLFLGSPHNCRFSLKWRAWFDGLNQFWTAE